MVISWLSFSQQQYFVSTSGNDTTGDGTFSNPYASVSEAADQANSFIATNPSTSVEILIRGGLYRNPTFTTFSNLTTADYDPENIGDVIWKDVGNNGSVVRLNNINGTNNAWITIKPYNNEQVIFECDGDIALNIRNCSFIKVEDIEIIGVSERIPLQLAWMYWGTYRYDSGGNWVYGDRKQDICSTYSLGSCSDIPPNVLTSHITYAGLPDISGLNVKRPNLFDSKGILVNLSNNIEIINCEVHQFPGGGIRVTGSDYVSLIGNEVHHNSARASVGTHGFVIEGLTADSGVNNNVQKILIKGNLVYSNYNELYSWVQSKTICTTAIDEGKGIALLRSGTTYNGFNGIIRVENNICYDNGKSGIHSNDVDNAEIINNTVAYNSHTDVYNYDLSGGVNAGISVQSSNNMKIRNNIAVVQSGFSPSLKALSEGQNCSGNVVTDNIVFGSTNNDFPGGYTDINPQFANPLINDFSLLNISPAIDTANNLYSPIDDFYSFTRGTSPDAGAIEYYFNNCGDITTTWNGSSWSNGIPNNHTQAIFSGNYTATNSLECCSVIVNNNATVTITNGNTLTVASTINVNSGSTLELENNAAIIQLDRTVSNSGNFVVKRNSSTMRRLDYTAWSSPVSGQQLQAFSPNTLPNRFYEYLFTGTTTPTAYQSVDPLTNFVNGKGYMIRSANNWSTTPTVFNGSFTGVAINGNVPQTLGAGYNLIGNPYTSPISAGEFLKTNNNVNALYFWTNLIPASSGNYPVNNFATYTLLGGVASASGSEIPNGIIQTGQGFFVNATASTIVRFRNSIRLKADASSQFFKTTNPSSEEIAENHLIRLNLNSSSKIYNQILVGYSSLATDANDFQVDGEVLEKSSSMIYTLLDNKEFAIQGFGLPFEINDEIPLGLKITESGNFEIGIENVEGLFTNQDVYIYDSQLNQLHNLKNSRLSFYSEEGTFNNRLKLVFKNQVQMVDSDEFINVSDFENELTFSASKPIESFFIYDISGKKILEKNNLNDFIITIKNYFSNGIYLVKGFFEDGKAFHLKYKK